MAMDINDLLKLARKNVDNQQNGGNYYSTKYAPPKKETKDKKLSENIRKFIDKQKDEDRQKRQEEREKYVKLMALRDQKSKNKINKMLKVTKSANKSVLDDKEAAVVDHTLSLDQDDYGYVSNEANAFYKRYVDRVKNVSLDNQYVKSRPQTITDLIGTKDRVKAAIKREQDEPKFLSNRQRSSATSTATTTGGTKGAEPKLTTTKTLKASSKAPIYDAKAEEAQRKQEEKEKRLKNKRTAPPPIDFKSLIKLAKKIQHEPVVVANQPEVGKKAERPMSAKEKLEWEERMRAKENIARRERVLEKPKPAEHDKTESKGVGRIPKIGGISKSNPSATGSTSYGEQRGTTDYLKRALTAGNKHTAVSSGSTSNGKTCKTISKPTNNHSMVMSKNSKIGKAAVNNSSTVNNRDANKSAQHGGVRRELSSNGQRSMQPVNAARNQKPTASEKQAAQKSRIYDDGDEDDYDSELDDFIDDDEEEEAEYSEHIRELFGYDRRKYHDDDDDANMESSFAQVQREEYISKKIGIQEDLEDMKMEELAKKRKQQALKRHKH